MSKLKAIQGFTVSIGCDPEFFLRSKGEVIGSEKVIPKGGFLVGSNKIIIDGVQAELNPSQGTCRESLGYNIGSLFQKLQMEMKEQGNKLTADFSRTVVISKDNLMELSEESRKFGCAPSLNIHPAPVDIAHIDPTEYLTRAAGGHIHLGKAAQNRNGNPNVWAALTDEHIKTVQMLDLILGNTSVLIDRDEGNIERRKVYGRAGEFRLPAHGLEYRTLSNYWLTSYQLMSFAIGMARLAVEIIAQDVHNKDTKLYDAFMSRIKLEAVEHAINQNDWDTAVDNFHAIEDVLMDVTPANYDAYPVHSGNVIDFKHFVNTIPEKGLQHWFKEEPVAHWASIPSRGTGYGFNDWLKQVVKPAREKAEKKAAA